MKAQSNLTSPRLPKYAAAAYGFQPPATPLWKTKTQDKPDVESQVPQIKALLAGADLSRLPICVQVQGDEKVMERSDRPCLHTLAMMDGGACA